MQFFSLWVGSFLHVSDLRGLLTLVVFLILSFHIYFCDCSSSFLSFLGPSHFQTLNITSLNYLPVCKMIFLHALTLNLDILYLQSRNVSDILFV